tara:strand:- start:88 stop:450 length:363 start_codon:yes stop_codon:yes gene_type:complete
MMKYFAKLDLNSKVIGITHVGDNNAPTEEAGITYLHKFHNYPFWKEYSKNIPVTIRKNGASIGMTYDEDRDAFIAPKPYPSWTLNEDTCRWEAPVAVPEDAEVDGKHYQWNEETTSWDLA